MKENTRKFLKFLAYSKSNSRAKEIIEYIESLEAKKNPAVQEAEGGAVLQDSISQDYFK